MEIIKLHDDNKRKYIDLLLLADEQESMIDKYLEHGEMFVLNENGVKAECVVTNEADGIYELKNIAVMPDSQRKGYGKRLIDYVFSHYADCNTLFVGTGDVPSTLGFYHKCGFTESHRIKNFFTDNYDHLIFEDGKQLVDIPVQPCDEDHFLTTIEVNPSSTFYGWVFQFMGKIKILSPQKCVDEMRRAAELFV